MKTNESRCGSLHKIYKDSLRRENVATSSDFLSQVQTIDISEGRIVSVEDASFLFTTEDAKQTPKISNKDKRSLSFLTEEMRLYVLYALTHRSDPTKNIIISCQKCNSYENLELHHNKYYPEDIFIDDIIILCSKCHRNSKTNSELRTVFEKDQRFCEMSHFKFTY